MFHKTFCCSPSLSLAKDFRPIRGTFGRRPLSGNGEGGWVPILMSNAVKEYKNRKWMASYLRKFCVISKKYVKIFLSFTYLRTMQPGQKTAGYFPNFLQISTCQMFDIQIWMPV